MRRFVLENPHNRFRDSGRPYFDEPLVGFAAVDDPLFTEFKKEEGDRPVSHDSGRNHAKCLRQRPAPMENISTFSSASS
jgi:hypothetical protein